MQQMCCLRQVQTCKQEQKQMLELVLPDRTRVQADKFWDEVAGLRAQFSLANGEMITADCLIDSNFIAAIFNAEETIIYKHFSVKGRKCLLFNEEFKKTDLKFLECHNETVSDKQMSFWLDMPVSEIKWFRKRNMMP